MSETINLLLYDNALSINDANGNPRDLESYQSLIDWTATNAIISVVLTPYVIPSHYTIKVSPTSTNDIILRLQNQSIEGTNVRPLDEISYLSHAMLGQIRNLLFRVN